MYYEVCPSNYLFLLFLLLYDRPEEKTVAISQMVNHVPLHIHWMHLFNSRICRYTYVLPTVIFGDQNRYVMKLFNIERNSTVLKSGVFLTKFGYKLLNYISAQPDYV